MARTTLELLLSLSTPEVVKGTVAPQAPAPSEMRALIKLATEHGMLPMLYRVLEHTDSIDQEHRALLQKAYYLSLCKNTLLADETLLLINALRNAGIEPVVLKGPLLIEELFGDPGVYPSTDIDLLVLPEALAKAGSVLKLHGYAPHADMALLEKTHYHQVYSKGSMVVELHWNLVKRHYRTRPELWHGRLRKKDLPGGGFITVLSPERQALYAMFRNLSHGFRPFKFLLYTAMLLECEPLDWARLMGLARELQMKRLVRMQCSLLGELLGSTKCEMQTQTVPWGQGVFNWAVQKGLSGQHGLRGTWRLVHLLAMDSPSQAARYLFARLLPSEAELRRRYAIKGGPVLVALYFLINPLLLPLKLLKKK